MKLFTKQRADDRLTDKQEALAWRMADGITRNQHYIANWLNGKTAGLAAKTWLVLLILFCAAFGAYCLHLLLLV